MNKRQLAFVATLCAAATFAGEITLEQAQTAVSNWIAKGGGFGKVPESVSLSGQTLEDPATQLKMHLVRIPGRGVVVTSADDRMEPILLFSNGDEIAAKKGNPVWELLCRDMAARAAAMSEDDGEALRVKSLSGRLLASSRAQAVSPKGKWAALLPADKDAKIVLKAAKSRLVDAQIWDLRRGPLLKTRWNQTTGNKGGIYNLYAPEAIDVVAASQADVSENPDGLGGEALVTNRLGRCPAGCVAVAGGQLMKYWAYPKSPLQEKDVTCRVNGDEQKLHFYGTYVRGNGWRLSNYGWGLMGEDEPVSAESSEYVSRLLSDIGVACGASYSATATSMSLYRLTSELKATFGYLNAVYYTGNLSAAGLREVIIPNLDAGCPVLLGIGNAHAVVADGYGFGEYGSDLSTFYLHINLGWGYSTHYWYAPPDVEGYSSIDEVVCNVSPARRGQLVSGRVTGSHGRPVSKMPVCFSNGTTRVVTTAANGIFHEWVAAGACKVWAQDADGTQTDPVSVEVKEMSTSVNGNRTVNIVAPTACTVEDIDMRVSDLQSSLEGASDATISSPISVSLACATSGAEIRYTLDGSTPTAGGTLYDGPIAIHDTTTLRAVAVADGMECSETLEQTWTFVDPVSRDNFADARPLSGASGSSAFSNEGYTKESGEPTHSSDYWRGGASAWAAWTAPATGDWTFWLSGTAADHPDYELDTQLAVYTGAAVDRLTRIAANDDQPGGGYSSRLSFHATEGVEYKIALDTYAGEGGSMALRWEEGIAHYATFNYSPSIFVPVGGRRVSVGVSSSTGWNVVESSDDWISFETFSGESGDELRFSLAANTTGAERVGSVTIRASNSELATLTIRQLTLDFVTTREEAEDAAWRQNKRILLVRGRETCGNTQSTLLYSVPSSTVKPLIDVGYVLWYSNCDYQNDANRYVSGLGSYTLPLVCVIDPLDMSTYSVRTTGYQSANALKTFLESAPAWDGLPSYTINFYRYDGTSIETNKVFTYGASTKLPTVASLGWARRGFKFKGWATSEANAKAKKIWKTDAAAVATAAQPGKTLNVYAVWELDAATSYAIIFVRNEGSGYMRTLGYKHGVSTALPTINGLGWARRGYEFVGWATSTANARAGTVWKTDGAKVATAAAKGKSLTVYAVWKLKAGYYSIRFNKNDGTGKWRELGYEYGKNTTLPTCGNGLGWTREGYEFVGWATSKANADAGTIWRGDAGVTKTPIAAGKTLNLYAVWRRVVSTAAATESVARAVSQPVRVPAQTAESPAACGASTYAVVDDAGVCGTLAVEAGGCSMLTFVDGLTYTVEPLGNGVWWCAELSLGVRLDATACTATLFE